MLLVRTTQFTRPKTSTQWLRLPRASSRRPPGPPEPRLPVAEFGAACQPLCYTTRCPADFSTSGGVATGTEVAERLRTKVGQPVSLVARWIVDRRVIAFSCGAGQLLPLFQFDFAAGCVRGGVALAMAELVGLTNDDELACWFAQPNAWLQGAAPAQVLPRDAGAVIAAARADRIVARG